MVAILHSHNCNAPANSVGPRRLAISCRGEGRLNCGHIARPGTSPEQLTHEFEALVIH